jgi:hypothetical protein
MKIAQNIFAAIFRLYQHLQVELAPGFFVFLSCAYNLGPFSHMAKKVSTEFLFIVSIS